MKLEEAIKEILQDLQELKNISQYREKQEIETLSKKILELYKTVLQEIEHLQEKYDTDTHILQGQLDLANAKKIELQKENEELKKRLKKYGDVDLVKLAQIKEIEENVPKYYLDKSQIQDLLKEE